MSEMLLMDLKNEYARFVQSGRVGKYIHVLVVEYVAGDPEPVFSEHIAQALFKSVRVKDAVTSSHATNRAAATFLSRSRESKAAAAFAQREMTWPIARHPSTGF